MTIPITESELAQELRSAITAIPIVCELARENQMSEPLRQSLTLYLGTILWCYLLLRIERNPDSLSLEEFRHHMEDDRSSNSTFREAFRNRPKVTPAPDSPWRHYYTSHLTNLSDIIAGNTTTDSDLPSTPRSPRLSRNWTNRKPPIPDDVQQNMLSQARQLRPNTSPAAIVISLYTAYDKRYSRPAIREIVNQLKTDPHPVQRKTPNLDLETKNAIREQAHALLGTMSSTEIIKTLYERYAKRYPRRIMSQIADLPHNTYRSPGSRKIKLEDIPQIKQAAMQGETYKSIANRYHVSEAAIFRIVKDQRQTGDAQPIFNDPILVNGTPAILRDQIVARVLLISSPIPPNAESHFHKWWQNTYRLYQTPNGEFYIEVQHLKAFGQAIKQLATIGITATVVKRAVLPPDSLTAN